MTKLTVVLNKEGQCYHEVLNVTEDNFNAKLDAKIKHVLLRYASEQRFTPSVESHQHLIDNFSQEELMLIAEMFFRKEYASAVKRTKKDAKKRQKDENPFFKNKTPFEEIFDRIKASCTEVRATSKEDAIQQLEIKLKAKGIQIDTEKLKNCKTTDEFNAELKEQLKDTDVLFSSHFRGDVFQNEPTSK